jgi:hypothetical protein
VCQEVRFWGRVLICFLVCVIPVFGERQVSAYADITASLIVKSSVASGVFFPKRILVRDFPVNIYCAGVIPKFGDLIGGQWRAKAEPLRIHNSWADSRERPRYRYGFGREVAFERTFRKTDISPMQNFKGWRLAGILDVHSSYGTPIWVSNSGIRGRICSNEAQWNGNVHDVCKLRQHIGSQLPLEASLCGYGLPNQNTDSYPSADHASNCRLHVSPVQTIQGSCIGFFFFCLSVWLFYGAAVRTLDAGRYWRTGGILLFGAACFLLTIEFFDAAAFGGPTWSSMWHDFLCAYTGQHCDECRWNQPFHDRQSVTQKHLTGFNCCNTLSDMANVLNTDKQTADIFAWQKALASQRRKQ